MYNTGFRSGPKKEKNIMLKIRLKIHSLSGVVEGIMVTRHASNEQTRKVVKFCLI